MSGGAGVDACPSVHPSISAAELVTNSDAWVTDVAERTAHQTMVLVRAHSASSAELSLRTPGVAPPERSIAVATSTSGAGLPHCSSHGTCDVQSETTSLAQAAAEVDDLLRGALNIGTPSQRSISSGANADVARQFHLSLLAEVGNSLRSALDIGTPSQRSRSSEVDGDVAKQSRVLGPGALLGDSSSQRPRTSETEGGSPQRDQGPFRQGDAHMPPSPSTSLSMAQMETQLGCTPVRSSSMNTSESVAAHLAQQTVAELWSACGGPTSLDDWTAQASQTTHPTQRQEGPVDGDSAPQQLFVPSRDVRTDAQTSVEDSLPRQLSTNRDGEEGEAQVTTKESPLHNSRAGISSEAVEGAALKNPM